MSDFNQCEAHEVISTPHCPICLLDERDHLQSELTAARDEAERLRGRVAELESGLRTITSYPDLREYVGTICHGAALSALGGVGDAWLLHKQAGAVEEAYKSTVLSTKGDHPQYEKGFDDAMNQYDRQMEKYVELLRQQSESIENGE